MNKREKHYISWVVLILYLCSFIAYSAYVDKTTAMKEQK